MKKIKTVADLKEYLKNFEDETLLSHCTKTDFGYEGTSLLVDSCESFNKDIDEIRFYSKDED